MALNIPLPDSSGTSLLKGLDTGSTMFSRLIQPVLEREKLKQEQEQFAQELALKKQAQARAGANNDLQRQILQQKYLKAQHEADPNYEIKQLQEKLNYIQNIGGQPIQSKEEGINNQSFLPSIGTAQGTNAEGNIDLNNRPVANNPETGGQSTIYSMGVGLDNGQEALIPRVSNEGRILSPEEAIEQFRKTGKHLGIYKSKEIAEKAAEQLHQQQMAQYGDQLTPQKSKNLNGLDIDEIKRALTYKALGLKVPANGVYKEPPELKRANDLRSKMDLAKYSHELKQADDLQKADLKNEATRTKTINGAKADIPHLEETLRALKIMKKIADDPKNNDLFGHWWLGHDKAAQRTKNPNAGAWQVYGLAPIIDAEMKMSSKGNIVALKSAQANKANFAEDRSVAQSKINAQIDQIKRRIKENQGIANHGSNDFSTMSDEELHAIVGGK